MRRRVARGLLVLALFAAGPTDGLGQARTYELVGGVLLTDTIQKHTDGQYLPVRHIGGRDTLWVWVQGVTKERGPDREAAQSADLVAWCFPGRYPDPRHVLPTARRVTVVTEQYDGKRWISFVSEKTSTRTGLGQ